jgi:hypothetical protein
MVSPVIQEFAYGLSTDSALLRVQVIAGEQIDQAEVLSLAAMAQSLFITTTLASRELGRIDDYRRLWGETARLFGELCSAWADTASDEQSITWLRGRLEHFWLLCEDRTSLYSVSESDRKQHAKCRESELHNPEPHSAVLKDFTEREVARIDAALNRRLHSH